MDLRIWGGGRVSWDEVREWHGHIYTTKYDLRNLQEESFTFIPTFIHSDVLYFLSSKLSSVIIPLLFREFI